jgi:hypothetical protein
VSNPPRKGDPPPGDAVATLTQSVSFSGPLPQSLVWAGWGKAIVSPVPPPLRKRDRRWPFRDGKVTETGSGPVEIMFPHPSLEKSEGWGTHLMVRSRLAHPPLQRSTNMTDMKKAEILKQRSLHRGDPEELVLGFVVNYSAPARLMRSFLPPTKGKEDILQAAARAYIIGIAACVETFFRDLYIYLLKRNSSLLRRALKDGDRKHLPRYLAAGVSAEEFAASQVSFQSAEAINQNISIFFSTPFFDILDQFELICEVPSALRTGPARLKLPSCWESDLGRVFSLRHEFAHDANSKTQVCTEEMQRIETTALLMCQITALLPGIASRVIVSGKNLPAILLISDLISDDWEVAEDGATTT